MTKRIEAYLDGSLSGDERIEFEALMAKDDALRTRVDLHREVNESIRDKELADLRSKLDKIGRDYSKGAGGMGPRRRLVFWRIAAAFLLLVILGAGFRLLVTNHPNGDRIYAGFYAPYETDVVSRSTTTAGTIFEQALQLYATGNYRASLSLLESLAAKEPTDYPVLYYIGLDYLGIQAQDKAIMAFTRIPEDWNHPLSIHRDWYLALACIKTGRFDQARPLLEKLKRQKGYYTPKAVKIIKKISS